MHSDQKYKFINLGIFIDVYVLIFYVKHITAV